MSLIIVLFIEKWCAFSKNGIVVAEWDYGRYIWPGCYLIWHSGYFSGRKSSRGDLRSQQPKITRIT